MHARLALKTIHVSFVTSTKTVINKKNKNKKFEEYCQPQKTSPSKDTDSTADHKSLEKRTISTEPP